MFEELPGGHFGNQKAVVTAIINFVCPPDAAYQGLVQYDMSCGM